jgi:hypothetical protein
MEAPDIAALLDFCDMIFEPVARHDGLAELGVVDGHEVDQIVAAALGPRTNGARRLCHAFDDQNTRHNGIAGKVTGKMRLAGSYILQANGGIVCINFDDAVHEQKRIAMRQQLHDVPDIGVCQ